MNEEIKVDLFFIHLITRISTSTITEYLNKRDLNLVYSFDL